MVDGFAKTPRYVLREGSNPTCPCVSQASSDVPATVIFGFSDKPEYDEFLSSSELSLTPYPLVKGFLKNQIEQDIDSLKLVVLDAVSSTEPILFAATLQSVLESFQSSSENVAISHRLILDESTHEYRIEAASAYALPKITP
ncbi:hypothetical protein Poly59_59350 [Rubripirellula reticaptiva]|uniref:Uncharacterized protein n=2 Tax=Rubripirellula reticaptiva TaxID=2528013 RepID=A0A5C6EGX0_9BACT|nr:hypothetical protein Poly59_59350 [Rubripirellula reticaptiva]